MFLEIPHVCVWLFMSKIHTAQSNVLFKNNNVLLKNYVNFLIQNFINSKFNFLQFKLRNLKIIFNSLDPYTGEILNRWADRAHYP